MQLFGYGNNIYLATSNSNSTGSIYFRNQTVSPFTYTDFATFSQAGSNINSSLVLNNALTCKNITCNNIIYNTPSQPSNATYIGYSNMTIYNAVSALNYGVYNNIVSITLPNAGTYDCDMAFPVFRVPGNTADCALRYCISTNSTTPDSVASNIIGYFTMCAGMQDCVVTPTFRHVCFISNNYISYSMVFRRYKHLCKYPTNFIYKIHKNSIK